MMGYRDFGVMDEGLPRIMIVDDEEPVRQVLGRLLSMDGEECILASDAAEARAFMKDQDFDLILCDIRMPGESGMDLIRYIHAEYPETAVIMVTALDDPEIAEAALEMGAYGYITKPFKSHEVLINVSNALRRRKLEIQNRLHREDLERMVDYRTAKLHETLKKLHKTMDGIVQVIAMTVGTRDPYTAIHQHRVADLACTIAKEMGLPEDRAEGIRIAGLIHDLGKISVPSEILSKPRGLTETEFAIIKSHSKLGYEILKGIDFPWPVAQMVLQHHERMDGSGYPSGLTGEAILLEARILAVADVVEAMASHRPYRPAIGLDKALEEISQKKGGLYASEVVEACLKVFTRKGFVFQE